MNIQKNIIEWFRQMGHEGTVPESLGNICNNSTTLVWESLMENVKPKDQILHIRNNIIIHRLKNKPLSKQSDFLYPIKEIDLFIRKQQLEKKIKSMRNKINDKQHKVKKLSGNNKMKYLSIENLKTKIKENEERAFLLTKKFTILEASCFEAQDTLYHCKSLTPVELEENPNTSEITETLHKCALKLENMLRDIPSCHKIIYDRSTVQSYNSKKKHTLQAYSCISEKTTYDKILDTTPYFSFNHLDDKENIISCENTTKESNRHHDRDIAIYKPRRSTKRESLGILPDSYLTNDANDSFLSVVNFQEKSYNRNHLSPISASDTYHDNVFFDSINQTTTQLHLQKDTSEKLYRNELVAKDMQNLLAKYNRQILWSTLQTMNENICMEITNAVLEIGKSDRNRKMCRGDIARLQIIHIQKELQILKQKSVIEDLISKINKQKINIFGSVQCKGFVDDSFLNLQRGLEMKLKEIALEATFSALKRELSSSKITEKSNSLVITVGKINKSEEEIAMKLNLLLERVDMIDKVIEKTIKSRECTFSGVHKIYPFVRDLTWAQPLAYNAWSEEIVTFMEFPLDYNRRCTFTDAGSYFRDLCVKEIPVDINPDTEVFYVLTEILESPFSPPEVILLDLIKMQMKLEALKKIQNVSVTSVDKKYTLEDFQNQESYVKYALEKLSALIYSASGKKTMSVLNTVKKSMEIWLDMPFKDFVSRKRLIEEKDLQFYEQQLNKLFEDIS